MDTISTPAAPGTASDGATDADSSRATAGAALTPERIMQVGFGFWGAKTLLSAVELGLFSELARGPLDADALRGRLGLHPRGARDFFDALVALGLLERTDGRYRNTPETDQFLDRAKPAYLGGLFAMLNARLYGFWGALSEALRTGQPQNEAKTGGNVFTALYENPDPGPLRSFLQGMTGANRLAAPAIAHQFPWDRYQTFLDLGTAQGNLPVTLALAHAHLQGIGLDVPAVRPIFEEYVAAHELSDRLRFQAADFFVDPLPTADVLILGMILEDWDLVQKRCLIARAYAALPSGGALIVYEPMIDDARRENAFALLQSLNMLLELPGGFVSTGAEVRAWLREAGFRETTIQRFGGIWSMVVGIK
jgi:O-methyltransferase domain/Dimerisation domain